MRRRHALGIISGAMAWPLAARAQQSRVYRMGALVIGLADVPSFQRSFEKVFESWGVSRDGTTLSSCDPPTGN